MAAERTDEADRRRYWSDQMENAYAFVEKMFEAPVEECGEGLSSLVQAVTNAGVHVTFSRRDHVGGHKRLYYLRAGLIDDFVGVARAMNERGWVLHVEDAFRTREMQRGLALQDYTFDVVLERLCWELAGRVPDGDLMLRRLAALIAPAPKVGTHMSGSAVDVSVYRRSDHKEIDRGGPYLELSELTPMRSPFVTTAASENRNAITEIFEHFGFAAYPYEFWHYSKGDAYEAHLHGKGGPASYGAVDFDPTTGRVWRIDKPCEPFHSPDEIRRMIESSLRRESKRRQ